LGLFKFMKKSTVVISAVLGLFMGVSQAYAGSVDGKLTKIRVYNDGSKVEFKSRIPNVSYSLKKTEVLKVMTRRGKTRATADLEKNGLILDVDRKARVTLDRVGDGLYIRGNTLTMFVSEKELDNVRG